MQKNSIKKGRIANMKNIAGIVLSYVFIAIIIVAAKFFEKAGKEASRKFIHIMLANWWFLAMFFFDNVIWASIVPLSFVIINYVSYKKDLIHVMERDEENKDGLGTVYYALSLFLIAIFTFGVLKKPEIGLCAILIMGYGDGLAAIIGRSIKSLPYKIGNTKKTVAGSATMFFISFFIVAIFLASISSPMWFLKAILLAISVTVIEAVSIKGTDNITVPIFACLLLAVMV